MKYYIQIQSDCFFFIQKKKAKRCSVESMCVCLEPTKMIHWGLQTYNPSYEN